MAERDPGRDTGRQPGPGDSGLTGDGSFPRGYGGQTMVGRLRRVLVRRPDTAFGTADPGRWGYTGSPDLDAALREHDELVAVLEESGAEVLFHDEPLEDRADAIFVHDPAIVTDDGAVLLSMGKRLRRGEELALGRRLQSAGVPVIARLEGPACAEGGDLVWLDRRTLAVGQGFRTNRAGLARLRAILGETGIECVPVDLPVHRGPASCLHLMSLVSMLAADLAVAHEPLLPVSFWRLLRDRDIELIPVPAAELPTQAPNVLALAPRVCLMLAGNPETRRRLEKAGCEVHTYSGRELSLKAEGGPTCLTRPLLRDQELEG